MYILKVSSDAGCSYQEGGQSEVLGELLEIGKRHDEQMLRWVIEDESGNIVEASAIHKNILGFMRKVNKQ